MITGWQRDTIERDYNEAKHLITFAEAFIYTQPSSVNNTEHNEVHNHIFISLYSLAPMHSLHPT